MSDRLDLAFESLAGKRPAFIAYATGYFPGRDESAAIINKMLESGADMVEIGVPFSDPVMDGPVIQETSRRALKAGATPGRLLDLAAQVRSGTEKPILLMSYYNPVFRHGLEIFAGKAADAGVDGVVIPDLPAEEMPPWKQACDEVGLGTIAFCSTTTSEARISLVSRMSSGFMYCVSLLGTTGPRDEISPELYPFMERVRAIADCRTVIGVGISTPSQCRELKGIADGIIVGSALMKAILDGCSLDDLGRMVAELARGLA